MEQMRCCCRLHQCLGEIAHPGGLKLTTRLAEVARVKPGDKILEIGCGRGATSLYLARNYGCVVTGIDISHIVLASAVNKLRSEGPGNNLGFLVAEAQELPFSSNIFDVVVSECSLSLQPDKERVISELNRVLKPGGRLVFTDMVMRANLDRSRAGEDVLKAWKIPQFLPCIVHMIKIESYIELLEKSGFQDIYTEDHSEALKQMWFSVGARFGGMKGFLQEMGSSCAEPGEAVHVAEYQAFIRQRNPGYALISATKQGERNEAVPR